MAATLMELTSDIVTAHATTTKLSTEQLLEEIQKVYEMLKKLEAGEALEEAAPAEQEQKPAVSVKQAFKKNEVICLVCGKGGMKTLTRHLRQAHGLKPGEYRKQFGIPRTQPLAAKALSDSRKQVAQERNLAANLAKAREARAAKLKAKKSK